ncbi:MAG: aspartate ammonia-lyase [Candidatus Nomurabacteria bacterium]|nr:aspartate ammonia-lyase [Candidatus Nomurabacteria bacterium]
MNNKRNSVLTGVSGEYFVAAELSRLGYIASITLRNTKGVDILCSNSEATKTVSIQVKTASNIKSTWILGDKSEKDYSPNLFYVFVSLHDNLPPEYYIVPSKIVADFTTKSHRDWLSSLSKTGKKHKDSNMRKFIDLEKKYLNKWSILGLEK